MRSIPPLLLLLACASCKRAPAPEAAQAVPAEEGAGTAGAGTVQGKSDQPPPPKELLDPAKLRETAPPRFAVRLSTSKGDFVVDVDRAWAPRAADRFYNLVRAGYFEGNRFFQVEPGVAVRFGVHDHPAVREAWWKARILDDLPPRKKGRGGSLRKNRRGSLSFVSLGPVTRTTQIVINLRDNPVHDRKGFVPFGRVASGMEVVEALTGVHEAPDAYGTPSVAALLAGRVVPSKSEGPGGDYVQRARISR